MEQYTEQEHTIFKENKDGSISLIPRDLENSDYQAYLNPVEHLTDVVK